MISNTVRSLTSIASLTTFTGLAALAAPSAFAQTADPTAASATAPQGAVVVAPAAAPAAPAAPASASGCVLGSHAGIDAADAATATQLVCAEVGKRSPSPSTLYRVGFNRLGNVIIVSLTAEEAGAFQDERHIQLNGIEEVTVAAPRLAEALLAKKSLDQTARVDTLVGDERHDIRTRKGLFHFGVGVLGVVPLAVPQAPAPGLTLDFDYEGQNYALDASFTGAAGLDGTKSSSFVALSVGGRYILGDGEVAPFVGGGLAWSGMSVDDGKGFSRGASGLGAYGQVGVELLRTFHTHVDLYVRADAPFYSIQQDAALVDAAGNATTATQSKYSVPITVGATILF